ncbi:hypothetical protein BDZ97DRAFT_1759728 [Flammula alnicola]|nr:hypothetical protein BDZ97DRAFT_1759728 [Flammula alnicola]
MYSRPFQWILVLFQSIPVSFHWNPVYSTGIQSIPLESSLFHWIPVPFHRIPVIPTGIGGAQQSTVHHIPPIMVKLQYSFHLHATRRILFFRKTYAKDEDFFQASQQFFEKYLQDHNLSPFTTLQTLLHKTSVTSKSTPRPNMVWWHEDIVTIGEISIDIPAYKTFLGKKLEETEKFVEENILLGLCMLRELDDSCKISQLKNLPLNEDVLGNGILLDVRDGSFDNVESAKFFLKMLQKEKLQMKQDAAGTLRFG